MVKVFTSLLLLLCIMCYKGVDGQSNTDTLSSHFENNDTVLGKNYRLYKLGKLTKKTREEIVAPYTIGNQNYELLSVDGYTFMNKKVRRIFLTLTEDSLISAFHLLLDYDANLPNQMKDRYGSNIWAAKSGADTSAIDLTNLLSFSVLSWNLKRYCISLTISRNQLWSEDNHDIMIVQIFQGHQYFSH